MESKLTEMKEGKAMKNKRFKRETAWLVVGTLMVSTMLAGCGKKNVDYDIDGSKGNKDSGGLQDKYDIPQSYDGSIATGDSGLKEITVKVSDISVPDTAIMYTEKLSKNDTGQEGRKKAAEAIFDKSKGIYAYDEDNMTKADIEAQIDSWETYKKNLGTDADHIKEANDAIAELQDKLEKAPDTYPAAGDYSALRYLGTIGEHEFIFTPPNDEDTDYSLELKEDIMSYRAPDEPMDSIRSGQYIELNRSVENGNAGAAEAQKAVNECKYSEQEALEIAEAFLKNVGCNDMSLSSTSALAWDYNDFYSTVETNVDGYYFTFNHMIKDQSIGEGLYAWNVDNFTQIHAEVTIPTDSCTIVVDDNGVIGADWTNNLSSEGEPEAAELLSFKELMKRADSSIPEYYAKYSTQYKSIEYNRLQLCYCLRQGEQEGEFEYVPAWIFTQVEEYTDDNGNVEDESNPDQMVVLDATDGSYIDIVEVSKALGTYRTMNVETE